MFENGAATILDHGLAYDRCAVGVVTDLEGAEALARPGVEGVHESVAAEAEAGPARDAVGGVNDVGERF